MNEIIITCSNPRDLESVLEAIIRGAAARRNANKLDGLQEKLKEDGQDA